MQIWLALGLWILTSFNNCESYDLLITVLRERHHSPFFHWQSLESYRYHITIGMTHFSLDLFKISNLTTLELGSNLDDFNTTGWQNMSSWENMEVGSSICRIALPSNLISKEILKMTKLKILTLERCNIGGPIWVELGSLTHLVKLRLSNSSFSGPIPSSLENLKLLKTLHLSSNSWRDPLKFGKSQRFPLLLSHVDLIENSLLTCLYQFYNNLSEEIPSSLGNLELLDST